jgi:hypothetical protein
LSGVVAAAARRTVLVVVVGAQEALFLDWCPQSHQYLLVVAELLLRVLRQHTRLSTLGAGEKGELMQTLLLEHAEVLAEERAQRLPLVTQVLWEAYL